MHEDLQGRPMAVRKESQAHLQTEGLSVYVLLRRFGTKSRLCNVEYFSLHLSYVGIH